VTELVVHLFGAPQVTRDGVPVTFDTRKAVALLAYLAVTGRPQRRESLAALLWPESDQSRARAALRRTLSVSGAVGPALVVGRGEISLDPTLTSSDVSEFIRLADTDDPVSWQQAVDLAPEPLLAGFTLRDSPDFDDWSATTSDLMRDRLTGLLARLVTVRTASGHYEAALAAAHRWTTLDPLSEPAQREVMRLLVWTGQRPAALRQYRTCVRNLDRELGVAPLPETTELHDDIRANRLAGPHAAADVSGKAEPGQQKAPTIKVEQPDGVVTAAEASPDATAQNHPLVGRAAELAILDRRWNRASQEPTACAVVGAPGLGRTALVASLEASVESAGGVVVAIRGHAGEADLAFAAVEELARALAARSSAVAEPLAAVGRPVETPGALIRLFEQVRDAVAVALSGPVPGLLVVDDAHWLDPTSADLLAYLVRRPPVGVLIVVTWRSDAPAPISSLDATSLVTLQPLTVDEVAETFAHLGLASLDAALAHQRTLGVPRLVVEYALAADAGVPARESQLRELVASRLDAAPAATRQVLGTSAILGSVSDPELLRQTSGRDESEVVDAIEDAVERRLLVEDVQRGGYDVPYDALRDLVLERVSLARRRLLHSRAADALERRHGSAGRGPSAAVIARHLAAAGRDEEAARWYWAAAVDAQQLYAYREALEHLRAAVALGFDPALTHAAIADALVRLGRYHDALVAYEQAAASIDPLDKPSLAVAEHKLAEVHDRLGDWAVAQAHLESAGELLTDHDDLPRKAQVCADLALVEYRQGDVSAAAADAAHALQLAERSDDDAALAQVHNVLGVLAAASGDWTAAAKHLERSREHAQSASDVGLTVAAMNNLARVFEESGRIDEALAEAEAALALGVQHGDRHREAALHDHVADLLHRAGRDSEAMEHLKAAAAAFAEVDDANLRPDVWKLVAW